MGGHGYNDADCTMISSSSGGVENKFLKKKKQQRVRKRDDDNVESEWVPGQEAMSGGRIWSEKDEITVLTVLKRMSDISDMTALYDAAKSLFEADLNKDQVKRKVWRLKAKFLNSSSTSEELFPASSHDAKIRKLSKEIWGDQDETTTTTVVGPHMTQKEFQDLYPRINACLDKRPPYNTMTEQAKHVIRECMLFISPKELREIEQNWASFLQQEDDLATKKLQLSIKWSKLHQMGRHAYNRKH